MSPIPVQQNYVTFLSPGTLVAEERTKPVDLWDVGQAVEMSKSVTGGRYGATPFAFYFTTRGRDDGDLDSREIARSGHYFLHARIETFREIEKRADPKESILLSNMRVNGWDSVVRNQDGYEWTQPLREGDTIIGR